MVCLVFCLTTVQRLSLSLLIISISATSSVWRALLELTREQMLQRLLSMCNISTFTTTQLPSTRRSSYSNTSRATLRATRSSNLSLLLSLRKMHQLCLLNIALNQHLLQDLLLHHQLSTSRSGREPKKLFCSGIQTRSFKSFSKIKVSLSSHQAVALLLS